MRATERTRTQEMSRRKVVAVADVKLTIIDPYYSLVGLAASVARSAVPPNERETSSSSDGRRTDAMAADWRHASHSVAKRDGAKDTKTMFVWL